MTKLRGFKFSGVYAGIKGSGKKDLALIFSTSDAVIAGVTTQNKIFAAPVAYCREIIASGTARAILVNSGNANAFTGEQGILDCYNISDELAKVLDIDGRDVAFTSTGKIGELLPVKTIVDAFKNLKSELVDDYQSFAQAIMTTDLTQKTDERQIYLSGEEVSVVGIAKGSGMIEPNMATMLGFICTDIDIDSKSLQRIISGAVTDSFNMISVDTDTSTNDKVLIMANGASGVKYSNLSDVEKKLFESNIYVMCEKLAKDIAFDGEGATKLLTVKASGLKKKDDARTVVKAVINSPLVKTAIYGEDPNWGRIAMAVGKSGVEGICEEKLTISIADQAIVKKGEIVMTDRNDIKKLMKDREIVIKVDCGHGKASAIGWGCDLTEKYVEINTDYN